MYSGKITLKRSYLSDVNVSAFHYQLELLESKSICSENEKGDFEQKKYILRCSCFN